MTLSEALTMAPLCVLIVVVGLFPQTLVGVMQSAVAALVTILAH